MAASTHFNASEGQDYDLDHYHDVYNPSFGDLHTTFPTVVNEAMANDVSTGLGVVAEILRTRS